MRLAAHDSRRERIEQNTDKRLHAIKSFFVSAVLGELHAKILFVTNLSQAGFIHQKIEPQKARRASVGGEVQP